MMMMIFLVLVMMMMIIILVWVGVGVVMTSQPSVNDVRVASSPLSHLSIGFTFPDLVLFPFLFSCYQGVLSRMKSES